jgi:hypothetical protein
MIVIKINESLLWDPFKIARNSRDGHQGRTLMIDDTPYIIVDNQKISPIERSSPADPTTADRSSREELTFGISDRVTISRQAREKARQHQARCGIDLSASEDMSSQRSPHRPELTYSPPQKMSFQK